VVDTLADLSTPEGVEKVKALRYTSLYSTPPVLE
jgi:hypothetical protein